MVGLWGFAPERFLLLLAEIAPRRRCAMTAVNLDPEHPINALLSPTHQQLYYGGPTFTPHRDQPVEADSLPDAHRNAGGQHRWHTRAARFFTARTGPGAILCRLDKPPKAVYN
jgi:hypothetical protein